MCIRDRPSIGPDGEFHFIGVFTDDQGATTWNYVEATSPVNRCEPVKQINSAGDGGDASPGDGSCDTGGTVDGEPECTLRAAIEESNAGSNLERIEFASDVSWRRIDPGSALPPITSGLDLVGLPGMVIDGSGAGTSAVGLRVEADGTTVSDLTLANFDSHGIHATADVNLVRVSATGNGGFGARFDGVTRLEGASTVQANGAGGIWASARDRALTELKLQALGPELIVCLLYTSDAADE